MFLVSCIKSPTSTLEINPTLPKTEEVKEIVLNEIFSFGEEREITITNQEQINNLMELLYSLNLSDFPDDYDHDAIRWIGGSSFFVTVKTEKEIHRVRLSNDQYCNDKGVVYYMVYEEYLPFYKYATSLYPPLTESDL